MNKFSFKVAMEDLQYVEECLRVANILISDDMKPKIFGEIFSKKLASNLPEFEGLSDRVKVLSPVPVAVKGVKIINKRINFRTGAEIYDFAPEEKKFSIATYPIQFVNFNLNGNELTFEMEFKDAEWSEDTIKSRIPKIEVKNIRDKEYVIKYPHVMKSREYWLNVLESIKDKLSTPTRKSILINWEFNVLKRKKLFPLGGSDVQDIRKMYNYCMEVFPRFRELSLDTRISYFNKGIKKASKRNEEGILGTYSLAKAILEEFMKHKIHSEYGRCKLNYSYYRNDEPSKRIDAIRYLDYVKNNGRHTSYTPFQIWSTIASKTYDVSENFS